MKLSRGKVGQLKNKSKVNQTKFFDNVLNRQKLKYLNNQNGNSFSSKESDTKPLLFTKNSKKSFDSIDSEEIKADINEAILHGSESESDNEYLISTVSPKEVKLSSTKSNTPEKEKNIPINNMMMEENGGNREEKGMTSANAKGKNDKSTISKTKKQNDNTSSFKKGTIKNVAQSAEESLHKHYFCKEELTDNIYDILYYYGEKFLKDLYDSCNQNYKSIYDLEFRKLVLNFLSGTINDKEIQSQLVDVLEKTIEEDKKLKLINTKDSLQSKEQKASSSTLLKDLQIITGQTGNVKAKEIIKHYLIKLEYVRNNIAKDYLLRNDLTEIAIRDQNKKKLDTTNNKDNLEATNVLLVYADLVYSIGQNKFNISFPVNLGNGLIVASDVSIKGRELADEYISSNIQRNKNNVEKSIEKHSSTDKEQVEKSETKCREIMDNTYHSEKIFFMALIDDLFVKQDGSRLIQIIRDKLGQINPYDVSIERFDLHMYSTRDSCERCTDLLTHNWYFIFNKIQELINPLLSKGDQAEQGIGKYFVFTEKPEYNKRSGDNPLFQDFIIDHDNPRTQSSIKFQYKRYSHYNEDDKNILKDLLSKITHYKQDSVSYNRSNKKVSDFLEWLHRNNPEYKISNLVINKKVYAANVFSDKSIDEWQAYLNKWENNYVSSLGEGKNFNSRGFYVPEEITFFVSQNNDIADYPIKIDEINKQKENLRLWKNLSEKIKSGELESFSGEKLEYIKSSVKEIDFVKNYKFHGKNQDFQEFFTSSQKTCERIEGKGNYNNKELANYLISAKTAKEMMLKFVKEKISNDYGFDNKLLENFQCKIEKINDNTENNNVIEQGISILENIKRTYDDKINSWKNPIDWFIEQQRNIANKINKDNQSNKDVAAKVIWYSYLKSLQKTPEVQREIKYKVILSKELENDKSELEKLKIEKKNLQNVRSETHTVNEKKNATNITKSKYQHNKPSVEEVLKKIKIDKKEKEEKGKLNQLDTLIKSKENDINTFNVKINKQKDLIRSNDIKINHYSLVKKNIIKNNYQIEDKLEVARKEFNKLFHPKPPVAPNPYNSTPDKWTPKQVEEIISYLKAKDNKFIPDNWNETEDGNFQEIKKRITDLETSGVDKLIERMTITINKHIGKNTKSQLLKHLATLYLNHHVDQQVDERVIQTLQDIIDQKNVEFNSEEVIKTIGNLFGDVNLKDNVRNSFKSKNPKLKQYEINGKLNPLFLRLDELLSNCNDYLSSMMEKDSDLLNYIIEQTTSLLKEIAPIKEINLNSLAESFEINRGKIEADLKIDWESGGSYGNYPEMTHGDNKGYQDLNNVKGSNKKGDEFTIIDNKHGGDCAVYATRDALAIINHDIGKIDDINIQSLRHDICSTTKQFISLYKMIIDPSKFDLDQVINCYKNIFGANNLDIFKHVISAYIDKNLTNQDNNEETRESLNALNDIVKNVNSWDNLSEDTLKSVCQLCNTFDVNIDIILVDHQLPPKSNAQQYYDYASQPTIWLSNSEINAYLLSLGFMYESSKELTQSTYKGTYITYKNLLGNEIYFYNDGNRQKLGMNWMAAEKNKPSMQQKFHIESKKNDGIKLDGVDRKEQKAILDSMQKNENKEDKYPDHYYFQLQGELNKLSSLALPDTWASENQILNYLKGQLKNNDNVMVVGDTWHVDDIGYAFPFDDFANFILNDKAVKLLLPIYGWSHFFGMMFEKNKSEQIDLYFFNPTAKDVESDESKRVKDDAWEINAKKHIQQISETQTNSYSYNSLMISAESKELENSHTVNTDTITKIKRKKINFGEFKDLSCNQQKSANDCGYIVGQSLYDLAVSEEHKMSIGDHHTKDNNVSLIAKIRHNFTNKDIVGEGNAYDVLLNHYCSSFAKAFFYDKKFHVYVLEKLTLKDQTCNILSHIAKSYKQSLYTKHNIDYFEDEPLYKLSKNINILDCISDGLSNAFKENKIEIGVIQKLMNDLIDVKPDPKDESNTHVTISLKDDKANIVSDELYSKVYGVIEEKEKSNDNQFEVNIDEYNDQENNEYDDGSVPEDNNPDSEKKQGKKKGTTELYEGMSDQEIENNLKSMLQAYGQLKHKVHKNLYVEDKVLDTKKLAINIHHWLETLSSEDGLKTYRAITSLAGKEFDHAVLIKAIKAEDQSLEIKVIDPLPEENEMFKQQADDLMIDLSKQFGNKNLQYIYSGRQCKDSDTCADMNLIMIQEFLEASNNTDKKHIDTVSIDDSIDSLSTTDNSIVSDNKINIENNNPADTTSGETSLKSDNLPVLWSSPTLVINDPIAFDLNPVLRPQAEYYLQTGTIFDSFRAAVNNGQISILPSNNSGNNFLSSVINRENNQNIEADNNSKDDKDNNLNKSCVVTDENKHQTIDLANCLIDPEFNQKVDIQAIIDRIEAEKNEQAKAKTTQPESVKVAVHITTPYGIPFVALDEQGEKLKAQLEHYALTGQKFDSSAQALEEGYRVEIEILPQEDQQQEEKAIVKAGVDEEDTVLNHLTEITPVTDHWEDPVITTQREYRDETGIAFDSLQRHEHGNVMVSVDDQIAQRNEQLEAQDALSSALTYISRIGADVVTGLTIISNFMGKQIREVNMLSMIHLLKNREIKVYDDHANDNASGLSGFGGHGDGDSGNNDNNLTNFTPDLEGNVPSPDVLQAVSFINQLENGKINEDDMVIHYHASV
ncbi:hypothetical protein [Cysteiniphilum halobium]|uniref:hypothetical protein n=1 Tax=Cysteiniphilum halobium TaxID=2219059 RepID=UPI000E650B19|nr:hypothetical protein [Cysteiniphilum halobium]